MDKKIDTYSEEAKIQYFAAEAMSAASIAVKGIQDEIVRYRTKLFKDADIKLSQEIEVYITEMKAKYVSSCNSELSKVNLENKKKYFALYEELKDKTTKSLEDKLANFTKSDEYSNYLLSLIDKFLTNVSGEFEIHVSENDMAHKDTIKNAVSGKTNYSFAVVSDTAIAIGGIRLYDKQSSMMYNETLDEKLRVQLESFYNLEIFSEDEYNKSGT